MPSALTTRSFLIANWKWFGLLALIFTAVVIDRVVRSIAGRLARRAAKFQRIHLDRDVLLSFERPIGLLGGVLAFEGLLPILGLPLGVSQVFLLATSFVATVAGVWAAYRLVDVVAAHFMALARRTDSKLDDILVPMLRRALKTSCSTRTPTAASPTVVQLNSLSTRRRDNGAGYSLTTRAARTAATTKSAATAVPATTTCC